MTSLIHTVQCRPSRQRVLAVLWLAVSVLFNASALAEVAAHSSHGTDHSLHSMAHSPAASEDEQADCHGESVGAAASHESRHEASHQTLPQSSSQTSSQAALESEQSEAPDCVCEQVCCPSSVQLTELRGVVSPQPGSFNLSKLRSDYLSITLDVVLPPPNFS